MVTHENRHGNALEGKICTLVYQALWEFYTTVAYKAPTVLVITIEEFLIPPPLGMGALEAASEF